MNKWEVDRNRWNEEETTLRGTTIHCTLEGVLYAGNGRGDVMMRESDGWTTVADLDEEILDIASINETLFVSAKNGTLAVIEDGGVHHVGRRPNVDTIDAKGFSSLIVDEDGTVIVSTQKTLYHVEKDSEGWSFRAMKEPPCERIDEIFRSTSGNIYVGGEDHCWARLRNGEWTVFSPRSTSDVIPDGRRAFFDRTRQFIPQPESDGPLVVAGAGVFSLRDDGTFEKEVFGAFVDGVHMPVTGRTILVHEQGLMARFD